MTNSQCHYPGVFTVNFHQIGFFIRSCPSEVLSRENTLAGILLQKNKNKNYQKKPQADLLKKDSDIGVCEFCETFIIQTNCRAQFYLLCTAQEMKFLLKKSIKKTSFFVQWCLLILKRCLLIEVDTARICISYSCDDQHVRAHVRNLDDVQDVTETP